jgi:hypothetical protein
MFWWKLVGFVWVVSFVSLQRGLCFRSILLCKVELGSNKSFACCLAWSSLFIGFQSWLGKRILCSKSQRKIKVKTNSQLKTDRFFESVVYVVLV